VFAAPLMSTIKEIGAFVSREAAVPALTPTANSPTSVVGEPEHTGDALHTGATPHADDALVPASAQPTNGTSER
jgi:hypothetical protein